MNALVLIPTYNERDNLPTIVTGVLAHPQCRVLVIDDNSPDGTGAIADDLAREHPHRLVVMHRDGPRGLGRAYLDGFRAALDSDADLICQMDADLSHDPALLTRLLLSAAAGAGLTIGSRYVGGGAIDNWPLTRKALSALANAYVRGVTGLSVRDCTSGYRCWRRDALRRVPLHLIQSDGYAFLVEVTYLAVNSGVRTAEVPIVFTERRMGHSKLSGSVVIESLMMPWRLVHAYGRISADRRGATHATTTLAECGSAGQPSRPPPLQHR